MRVTDPPTADDELGTTGAMPARPDPRAPLAPAAPCDRSALQATLADLARPRPAPQPAQPAPAPQLAGPAGATAGPPSPRRLPTPTPPTDSRTEPLRRAVAPTQAPQETPTPMATIPLARPAARPDPTLDRPARPADGPNGSNGSNGSSSKPSEPQALRLDSIRPWRPTDDDILPKRAPRRRFLRRR
jgi:hypothetical protein